MKKSYNIPQTWNIAVNPLRALLTSPGGGDKPGGTDDPTPSIPVPGSAPRKPF